MNNTAGDTPRRMLEFFALIGMATAGVLILRGLIGGRRSATPQAAAEQLRSLEERMQRMDATAVAFGIELNGIREQQRLMLRILESNHAERAHSSGSHHASTRSGATPAAADAGAGPGPSPYVVQTVPIARVNKPAD